MAAPALGSRARHSARPHNERGPGRMVASITLDVHRVRDQLASSLHFNGRHHKHKNSATSESLFADLDSSCAVVSSPTSLNRTSLAERVQRSDSG